MSKSYSNFDNPLSPRLQMKDLWPYFAIFFLALGVRLLYLYAIIDHPVISILLGDAESYDAWAQEIVQKGWVGDRTFYQAPFYPYFLALIYTIGGQDFILVRLVQAVIGASSCVLLAGAGSRFFDKKSGLLAGLLLSFYAPAIFFDVLMQKAVLGMFFMCLLLFLMSTSLMSPSRKPPFIGWLFMGIVLACFALVRENALILIPAIGLWMLVYFWREGWSALLLKGLLLALGLAMIFLPVTFRNYVVGGEFILTTSQLGPNFFIGNNKEATGFYRPLIWDRSDWKFERKDAQELAEQDLGKPLTPKEISAYWLEKTFKDIRNDPMNWLNLMGRKWLMVWNATEIADSESIYAHYGFSGLLKTLGQVFNFGLLLPLAIIGICMNWRHRQQFWGLLWVWLCFAGSVTLFFVFARYRHPMTAIMLLFAATGLVHIYRVLSRKQVKPFATSVMIALPFAVFVNWPIVTQAKIEAPTHFNIGYELERRDQLDAAKDAYLLSLDLDPSTLAHNNLGMIAMKQNRPNDAIDHFRDAVAAKPDNWDARINLGIALSQTGRKYEAVEQYREVLRNEPDYNPALYYNIACYYSVSEQPVQGMNWLKKALEHGYSNWELIRTDPDLENVRQLPEFRTLSGQ